MTELRDNAEFDEFVIQGQLQDGVTSRSQPAQLRILRNTAMLVTNDHEVTIAPADLNLSDRVGDTPRRISWPGDAVFVTRDNAGADRLERLLPGGAVGRLAFRLESNLTLAISALLFVAGLMAVVMLWGVPSGARYLAQKIPEPLGVRAGDQVLATLDRLYLEPSSLDPDRARELRAYLRAQDSYPPSIEFRKAGETIGPNAFALPGGYVVITDELIALAESDEEILAVYLHEVGHARGHHAETGVLANSAWLVILTIATGDISGMTETVFGLPVILGQMAFSRDLEREADDYSISKLKELNESPALLAAILERMSTHSPAKSDTPSGTTKEHKNDEVDPESQGLGTRIFDYLSTHPPTVERLKRIRAAAAP